MPGVALARRGALQSAAPPPPVQELTPGWAVGRSYEWPADASSFTLSNFTQTTDGSTPVLVVNPADSFTPATIFTNATDIEHARVTVEFRAVPQEPLSITNISVQPHIRRQDANNAWFLDRTFQDGASWLQPVERLSGTNMNGAVFGGVTNLNNSNQSTYQTLVTDVFNDVIRAKTWFDGEAVPDWLGVPLRFYPAYGFGGSPTTTQDNIPMTGAAGLRVFYGGMVSRVLVQELVPARENLYLNAELDPGLRDAFGRPMFWGFDAKWNDETTGIIEIVDDVLGPDGETLIPAIRCARTAPGETGDGPELVQQFFLTGAADNASYTRDRPIPTVGPSFPAQFEWSVWIKRTGMANDEVAIGSICEVNYYFDAAGTSVNAGYSDYYTVLGPNAGTQGWTRYSGVLTVHEHEDIVRLDRYLGIHDEAATGEMLIAGGAWCPRFSQVT